MVNQRVRDARTGSTDTGQHRTRAMHCRRAQKREAIVHVRQACCERWVLVARLEHAPSAALYVGKTNHQAWPGCSRWSAPGGVHLTVDIYGSMPAFKRVARKVWHAECWLRDRPLQASKPLR